MRNTNYPGDAADLDSIITHDRPYYLDCGCYSEQGDHTCMGGGRPSWCRCGAPDDCYCPSIGEIADMEGITYAEANHRMTGAPIIWILTTVGTDFGGEIYTEVETFSKEPTFALTGLQTIRVGNIDGGDSQDITAAYRARNN